MRFLNGFAENNPRQLVVERGYKVEIVLQTLETLGVRAKKVHDFLFPVKVNNIACFYFQELI